LCSGLRRLYWVAGLLCSGSRRWLIFAIRMGF